MLFHHSSSVWLLLPIPVLTQDISLQLPCALHYTKRWQNKTPPTYTCTYTKMRKRNQNNQTEWFQLRYLEDIAKMKWIQVWNVLFVWFDVVFIKRYGFYTLSKYTLYNELFLFINLFSDSHTERPLHRKLNQVWRGRSVDC